MADIVEQINEARKVVEELGGKKTKGLDELKGELDRMIEVSKQPGYSPDDAEILVKKRALVVDAMETALHVLVNETLDETAAESEKPAERPAEPTSVPAATQSAFVSPSEQPKQAPKAPERATGTSFQRFMGGASTMASNGFEGFKGFLSWASKGLSDFFSNAGTSISEWWNSWFKKIEASQTSTVTKTPAQPSTTPTKTANPVTQQPYDEAPGTQSPATIEPSTIAPQGSKPAPALDKPPEPDPLTADTQPETASFMDGKAHEIGGHNIVWSGIRDNLLSIDDRVFGVTTPTIGKIMAISPTLEKRGDTLVIRAAGSTMELTEDQVSSLIDQTLNGERKKQSMIWPLKPYDYVSVNLKYTTVLGEGVEATRTSGSQVIELLPK